MAKGSFHKIGAWRKVEVTVASIRKEMEIARMMSLKRFGLKVEAVAKGHMSKQDLNWLPLNPKYVAQKVKAGLSNNILIATSSYFQGITSFVILDTSYTGIKKHLKEEDGTFIADIARVHEYGSSSANIPARPLWKPTLNEVLIWQVKKNRPEMHLAKNMQKYK